MIKIFVASDHAGLELKSKILGELQKNPYVTVYETHDLGPHSTDSVDYPDFADQVCKRIHGLTVIDLNNETNTHPSEYGILICGSGQGMNMRANKYAHVRAALCWNKEVAHLSRAHNDANVLCLGARTTAQETNLQIVFEFLATPFEGGRHRARVIKVNSPIA